MEKYTIKKLDWCDDNGCSWDAPFPWIMINVDIESIIGYTITLGKDSRILAKYTETSFNWDDVESERERLKDLAEKEWQRLLKGVLVPCTE